MSNNSSRSPRLTKQRSAMLRAFQAANRPLSPNEVLQLAAGEVPNLGIATVYRNINTMVQDKKLQVRELPGQPARYCLPREDKPSLFVCEKTNRVFHVDDKNIKLSVPNLPEEFKVSKYEIIFYGNYEGQEATGHVISKNSASVAHTGHMA